MQTVDQLVWWVLSGVLGILAIIIRYTVTRLISKIDQLVKIVEVLTNQNAVFNTVINALGKNIADHETRIREVERKQTSCQNYEGV